MTERIHLFGYPAELQLPDEATVRIQVDGCPCGCGPVFASVPLRLERGVLGEPILKMDFAQAISAIDDARTCQPKPRLVIGEER